MKAMNYLDYYNKYRHNSEFQEGVMGCDDLIQASKGNEHDRKGAGININGAEFKYDRSLKYHKFDYLEGGLYKTTFFDEDLDRALEIVTEYLFDKGIFERVSNDGSSTPDEWTDLAHIAIELQKGDE